MATQKDRLRDDSDEFDELSDAGAQTNPIKPKGCLSSSCARKKNFSVFHFENHDSFYGDRTGWCAEGS